MRRINIGVLIDQTLSQGGGFQACISDTLEIIKDLKEENIIILTTIKDNISILRNYNIKANYISATGFNRIKSKIRRQITNPFLYKIICKFERFSPFEKFLKDLKIDLVYFLSPSTNALDLDSTNYILRVWDISHLDDPEFPEVRQFKEFESRENFYRKSLPKATSIIVESKEGKLNLMNRYNIDKSRIYVKSLAVQSDFIINKSNYEKSQLDLLRKYNITMPYIFYPAQFWAHKNHIYILEGLRIIKEKYKKEIGAVFTGGDKGNLNYIKSHAEVLGIQKRIFYPGFVTSEELYKFYKQSLAVVMPTYFGPTNIPPLEAFELGVPLLYSDLKGIREQVKGAALLIDLMKPSSLASNLMSIIDDNILREKLITSGKKKLEEINKNSDLDYLKKIIIQFKYKRMTWK